MPDITNKISYDTKELAIIIEKKNDPNFNSKIWEGDDLLSLRVAIRNFYRNQQGFDCAYCKHPVSVTSALNAHVEHIVAKSLRPEFMFEAKNLCVICADCNEIKRDQEIRNEVENVLSNDSAILYPRSSTAFKIVHPHFDIWDEHIVRFGQHYYFDKSKKGAFTILTCLLNRRLHKTGWEKDIYTDAELSEVMNKYLSASDSSHKSRFLNDLRKMIIQN